MIQKRKKGFTFLEVIVGTALFLVIALAGYQAYTTLFILASANQYKILAIELADEQFEIVRNMPYNNIGIVNGIPNGVIPGVQAITRGGVAFTVTTTIRNIDLPFDGIAGSSTKPDLSPADNKFVSLTITCASCKNFPPMTLTTEVAPQNLETASTNGALVISAFDANGNSVPGASIHVVNSKVTPSIVIDDTTNNSGVLEIVDAPPGSNAYNITATKAGYSTDKTYPPGGSGNPNPSKPDATVLLQQVTPISFSIDQLGALSISSVTSLCSIVPNVGLTVVGSKMIGPGIPKYSATTSTNTSGILNLNNMEWDSYTFGLNDSTHDLAGLNLLNPVALNPNSTQNVLLVVAPKTPNSLLVTVKDSSSLLPVTNATVTLSNTSGFSSTQTTGQGSIDQTDWSGGSGQSGYSSSTANQYWANDGHIDTGSPSGDLKLVKNAGLYSSQGNLESSTFDTGSASNFHSLIWLPSSQPVGAGANSVKIQIATNATSTATTTWTYLGPDGTNATYYTSSNSTINAINNNNRYFRYKVFLSTQSATNTPDVSDVAFTFTTACTPPGQVIFQGLSSGSYKLNVSETGYTTSSTTVSVSSSWKEQQINLGP